MDTAINISNLNDFIFCPASIYFHNLYQGQSESMYEETTQVLGKQVHQSIDRQNYSTSTDVLQGIPVYSEALNLFGKIDLLEVSKKHLIERKRQVKQIFDGYVFQVYAQYFCLSEMGYEIQKISIRSYIDNKVYSIKLPDEDLSMKDKFFALINEMSIFNLSNFRQSNAQKCLRCNYAAVCDKVCDVE